MTKGTAMLRLEREDRAMKPAIKYLKDDMKEQQNNRKSTGLLTQTVVMELGVPFKPEILGNMYDGFIINQVPNTQGPPF